MTSLPWNHPASDPLGDILAIMKTMRGDAGPDPVHYGATHVTCVWCGYHDRMEFMQVTFFYTSEDDENFYFECKNALACEQRVALSFEAPGATG